MSNSAKIYLDYRMQSRQAVLLPQSHMPGIKPDGSTKRVSYERPWRKLLQTMGTRMNIHMQSMHAIYTAP
jgi:hypothetical protein